MRKSNLAMNHDIYLNECIKKCLIPYITVIMKEVIIFRQIWQISQYVKKVVNYLYQKSLIFLTIHAMFVYEIHREILVSFKRKRL